MSDDETRALQDDVRSLFERVWELEQQLKTVVARVASIERSVPLKRPESPPRRRPIY